MEIAKREGFAFGVKLVRGAYMDEVSRARLDIHAQLLLEP